MLNCLSRQVAYATLPVKARQATNVARSQRKQRGGAWSPGPRPRCRTAAGAPNALESPSPLTTTLTGSKYPMSSYRRCLRAMLR